jgi:hypothetical protein
MIPPFRHQAGESGVSSQHVPQANQVINAAFRATGAGSHIKALSQNERITNRAINVQSVDLAFDAKDRTASASKFHERNVEINFEDEAERFTKRGDLRRVLMVDEFRKCVVARASGESCFNEIH